jgi:hypothetical protein
LLNTNNLKLGDKVVALLEEEGALVTVEVMEIKNLGRSMTRILGREPDGHIVSIPGRHIVKTTNQYTVDTLQKEYLEGAGV